MHQGRTPHAGNRFAMRWAGLLACAVLAAGALPAPAAAKIGGQAAAFASGPLVHQLQLTFGGQQALAGPAARVLHRYVSDDGLITVDLVVRAGVIEQQVLYLPADVRRAPPGSFFLQEALGSISGSQRGHLAFRAAVANRSATGYRWGGLSVRFTPMANSMLQVLASR